MNFTYTNFSYIKTSSHVLVLDIIFSCIFTDWPSIWPEYSVNRNAHIYIRTRTILEKYFTLEFPEIKIMQHMIVEIDLLLISISEFLIELTQVILIYIIR
jgi:hypothetical protein